MSQNHGGNLGGGTASQPIRGKDEQEEGEGRRSRILGVMLALVASMRKSKEKKEEGGKEN